MSVSDAADEDSLPESDPWLTVDELATWRVFWTVVNRLPQQLNQQLQQDSGLTVVEYYVLAGLSEEPDQGQTLSELALYTNVELSRMSHLVNRMEQRGLVQRLPDTSDRRATRAKLTPAGLAALRDAAPGHVGYVRQLVFDGLSLGANRQLGKVMGAVQDRLDGRSR